MDLANKPGACAHCAGSRFVIHDNRMLAERAFYCILFYFIRQHLIVPLSDMPSDMLQSCFSGPLIKRNH